MEASVAMAAAAWVVAVAILIWALNFVNWVWLRPKKLERDLRQRGFAGNSYRFLYGDMKENAMMIKEAKSRPINLTDDILPRVIPFVYHTVKKYGKNSFTWFGPIPRVNIMNPEHIREIFTKIYDFQKPKSNPLIRLLANGLVSRNGDKWAKHRRLLNPAFHQEKLKLMLPAFYQSCNEMIVKWEKLVSQEGSSELDVWPDLSSLTSDAISRTAFGSSYEEGKKIFQLQDELGQLIMQVLQSIYIPGLRFLPTKRNKRMKEVERQIRASLKGVIDKRLNAMKDGKAANDDLLGILLESNLSESKGLDGDVGMSMDDVIEECKLFYFAGQETTSVLLAWTMVLLSQYPDWQARAREEVLSVFGNNEPNFDSLNHLKIVTMILYEVLRLYPPVLSLVRTIHKETKLGNLTLPAGVQVALPTALVHHDPELWGHDVKEFKPERFGEGISKATKNQVSFFPFAWGSRICIGQNFALIEAKMAMAMMLKRFWFELSPSYAHAPFPVITLRAQHGVHVILHKL
ncbi:hypothetical protein SLE2022_341060 [Rubroshorea leprosula]